MNYELAFDLRALKEWQKLGVTVREQFKKKLEDVLKRPRNPSAKLRDLPDCYKIKRGRVTFWRRSSSSGSRPG